jgi:hypothetical protein
MSGEGIQSQMEPYLSFQVSLSAPTLTSSPGVRISGSRLVLAAAYRLSASLSYSDQQLVLLMTAVLGGRGSASGEEIAEPFPGMLGDFDSAAAGCLIGLYVRLVLGRPSIVVVSDEWERAALRGENAPVVTLRLEHARAVSSTRAEYYFRPTLLVLRLESPPVERPASERAFMLAYLADHEHETERFSLRAVRKGAEVDAALIPTSFLPVGRSNLVEAIQSRAGGRYERLVPDLLGLDEWRFQEGLRAAFSDAAALSKSVGTSRDGAVA